VARRRKRDGIAETFGIAGGQPVGTYIHPDERVAVALADAIPLEIGLSEVVVVFRVLAPEVQRKPGDLAGRRFLPLGWQSGRVDEPRGFESDSARPFVHRKGKILLGAGHGLSDHNAAVVRLLNRDAL